MSNNTVNKKLDKKILQEASDYYLALQDGTISGAELRAWQSWFLNSRDHRIAFRRLEALWGALEHVSADTFDNIDTSEVFEHPTTEEKQKRQAGSVISLVTQDLKERPVEKGRFHKFAGMAAGIAAVFISGLILTSPSETPQAVKPVQYETANAAQQLVKLSDGSIVELGPDSKVQVQYSEQERAVSLLEGQAVFTVAKNPNRPFIVRAGTGTVTAIGTVFNVVKTAHDVKVKVLEGTVAVRPSEDEEITTTKPVALVTAGSITSYSDETGLTPVEKADVTTGLDWRVGVLRMVDKPLADVIQELNRYVEKEISIGDEAVGQFYFTGTVYPDQVDNWLEGLQKGYPLKVVRVGSSTVLMHSETK